MLAIKVAVIESERGWGSKIDDYMVCLSIDDANLFITEFNSKNNNTVVPSWYMYAETQTEPIELTSEQYQKLLQEKRMWLSAFKKL